MTVHSAQSVRVPGPAGTLAGFLYQPAAAQPGPAVVLNHGSDTTQDSKPGVARLLTDAGYRVLTLHRRGYETSDGPSRLSEVTAPQGTPEHGRQVCARLRDEAADVAAGVRWLRDQPDVHSGRVSVLGSSYGGITSILATALAEEVAGCVSFAAAAMSWGPVPEVQGLLLEHLDAGRCPVLLLQAANDFDLTPSEVMLAHCGETGRDCDRVILPPFGANELEAHQVWVHAPQLWAPQVLPFLARVG